ncbi:MAG: hypothetical protein ACQETI_06170 [Halobacteriota archaeon]
MAMPHWHHHCGCPYHRRGHLCPWCDEPAYWPETREEWDQPPQTETDSISRQLESLHDAIERLNRRIDALEEG